MPATYSVILVSISLFLVLSLLKVLARRLRQKELTLDTWETVHRRILPVRIHEIATIAEEHLQPTQHHVQRKFEEVWDLIGRTKGLRAMKENAELLIELAALAEKESGAGTLLLTEQMKHDGTTLRRAILNFTRTRTLGQETKQSLYLQEAAFAYHRMRMRMLAAYPEIALREAV